ncbi:thioredoxin domain-containing protein [Nostoc sp. UIC 10630]|uniref:DsbA family protein n=1 Tax=Nostoc sp. UIC 10630 TaxID=2100146 RepID=UPI0013D4D1D8|nr:thioredoxin domain-containing protein [Nostoc sp. UIC 10630]NEU83224.1 thioredoxin domain-containing protein [Nostoc sp. UIC 10630]
MKIRTLLKILLITILGFFFVIGGFSIIFANEIPSTESKFENEVREVILKNPEIIIEAIEKYHIQQEKKLIQQRKTNLNKLLLKPEKLVADSPRKGAQNLDIILIEFADFQCSFCLEVQPVLKNFIAKHKNELTFVYKHLPLFTIHPDAMNAAKASWAAGKQGKFWEYHDALFENQKKLGEELYLEIASSLNLNMENFKKDSELATKEILKDIELASSLNITSTPFFILNHEFISGTIKVEDLETLLKQAKARMLKVT